MVNSIESNNGRKVWLYRANTANADLSINQYLPPTKIRIGVNGSSPSVGDINMDNTIPLSNGTVLDDGSNVLTGSSGADNSTNNTTTFKPGAGASDVTAQNLLADGTGVNVLKTWTIAALTANADPVKYTGCWFYVLNSVTLAKIVSAEFKLGSDASNYYSKTVLNAGLSTGWNWINFGVLNTNTETGTVGTPIDTFIIDVTTGIAGDEFAAGALIYDLLHQWEESDTIGTLLSGYPTLNFSSLKATHAFLINTLQANGFLIDNVSMWNEDALPLMTSVSLFDEGESKSDTDEFRYVFTRRTI